MPEPAALAPDRVRALATFARALVSAARNSTLYPPEHPAVAASIRRMAPALATAVRADVCSLTVTPETLLVGTEAPEPTDNFIQEAASLLHDHGILQISFEGKIPDPTIHRFLELLRREPDSLWSDGGPASIWQREGHRAIRLRQIDYRAVLKAKGDVKSKGRRDDVWRSLVHCIGDGTEVLNELERERLLAVALDADETADLVREAAAPKCAADGSPMVRLQAATVLTAFRQMAGVGVAMAPDRYQEVIQNLATALSRLDAAVALDVLQARDERPGQLSIMTDVAAAFDEEKIAKLLTMVLASQGGASTRLADVFKTIVPEPERRERVVSATRARLADTDFGRSPEFADVWGPLESMLVSYDERAFVSDDYRSQLSGARDRGLAAGGPLPEELTDWLLTVDADHLRGQMLLLLKDLFTLETDSERAVNLVRDLVTAAEELLEAGKYGEALSILHLVTAGATTRPQKVVVAARARIEAVGRSSALQHAFEHLGRIEEDAARLLRDIAKAIGPSALDAIRPSVLSDEDTLARTRASDLIVSFGAAAIKRLASLLSGVPPATTVLAIDLLGRIGTPEVVSLLQPLLGRVEPAISRAAAVALAQVGDNNATGAVHLAIRAADPVQRKVMIDALAGAHDKRCTTVLLRVLAACQPLGRDHQLALDTLGGLGELQDERAVPEIGVLLGVRRWFARARSDAIRRAAIDALRRIDGPEAAAALAEAARTGDRRLRYLLREAAGN